MTEARRSWETLIPHPGKLRTHSPGNNIIPTWLWIFKTWKFAYIFPECVLLVISAGLPPIVGIHLSIHLFHQNFSIALEFSNNWNFSKYFEFPKIFVCKKKKLHSYIFQNSWFSLLFLYLEYERSGFVSLTEFYDTITSSSHGLHIFRYTGPWKIYGVDSYSTEHTSKSLLRMES